MPWAPRRPCPAPGCPRLLGPGERCPEHGTRPFATSTYRHRRVIPDRLRREILDRDGHTCQLCGAPATDVDHVVPLAAGGDDHPSNLASLCRSCHRRKTGQQAARARG
ncbi:MAG: HNH endonuclease [Solirubrobacterales bacterium]|nr:HNH endonuclease [Solirubrobacterales bacterium]